jgi:DNA-binding XRE family transcriptional regulator
MKKQVMRRSELNPDAALVREIRETLGYDQEDFAYLLGLGRSMISRIETGSADPTEKCWLDLLVLICHDAPNETRLLEQVRLRIPAYLSDRVVAWVDALRTTAINVDMVPPSIKALNADFFREVTAFIKGLDETLTPASSDIARILRMYRLQPPSQESNEVFNRAAGYIEVELAAIRAKYKSKGRSKANGRRRAGA